MNGVHKTLNSLRKIYKKYVKWKKRQFKVDVRNWSGVAELKLPEETIDKIYEIYYKCTFTNFTYQLKHLIFSKNIFTPLKKTSGDVWDCWYIAKFLTDCGIVTLKKDKVKIVNEKLIQGLIRPLSKEEIILKLKEKLGKLNLNSTTLSHFKEQKFMWKSKYSQIPICMDSTILIIQKILEYIPLPQKFLFIGDDDFTSILLGMVEPRIQITVIDIDNEILNVIDNLASAYNLNINTKQADVRKNKLKEKFIGFLANPPYTPFEVESFIRFGLSTFGLDGGTCFLVVGDIGNRWLWLHKFFAKNNLILKELKPSCIIYPFKRVYSYDEIIIPRLKAMNIPYEKNPWIVASLLILDYIPWQVKKIPHRRDIHSYI